MSGLQPVAVYAMKVPPGDIMVPAVPAFAAMFRLTMAAIDPSAEPELEDPDDKRPPRATLKLIRVPAGLLDEDDDFEDDEDYLPGLDDDDDEEDDEDIDEEVNGGPSEKKSKAKAAGDSEDDDEDMDDEDDEDDDEDDAAAIARLSKLMKSAKGKGKAKALDGEDGDDEEEDEDDEALEMDEVVVCTLDPEKNYQQTLDFVVGEGEKVFFKVSGAYTVYLTGNYVIPQDDGAGSLYDEEDEEEDYDLSPDEDELAALEDADEDSDALDDLADPRITEIDEEDDVNALKAINPTGKGKNKRRASDDDDEEDEDNLDDMLAKSLKKEEPKAAGPTPATNGGAPEKLSKAEKKRLKKLKKNDGEAVAVEATVGEAKKEAAQSNGSSEKKVQFAKNLEQGPTPSTTPPASAKSDSKEKSGSGAATLGVKEVQGVTVDDRKIGSGPAAKKGARLEMRYIGKLDNGKVFDSNKSGKPFSFKLGAGEVIKGWDIGLQGIQVGGERRLTIPAHLAYGNKALPGIPKNSKLTFDIKCLAVK
ncbi:uncharacterized protein Z519_00731 [Cladophialophora bantiana CBS 173.52]|uniref:peptidylprolyl isomerase n=1 Tax=Cladophialophora bantiana (strain ATCC 10958 / CBS 173.52 / CDC B-1940 / NIH 8579) TaxID=1442370 RepID=A0A0D2I039_CLAB1|nr:uncharacterized protein Z519_00731 [Cladophialophora bantiana CBS 173.52]KIW99068.1 hypothetical protein Z519_00731 [Cladophialophora bantiana CBS 173.52]